MHYDIQLPFSLFCQLYSGYQQGEMPSFTFQHDWKSESYERNTISEYIRYITGHLKIQVFYYLIFFLRSNPLAHIGPYFGMGRIRRKDDK